MYYNFNQEHPELIGSSSGDHLYVGVWAMLPIEIIVHLGLDYKVLCRILLGMHVWYGFANATSLSCTQDTQTHKNLLSMCSRNSTVSNKPWGPPHACMLCHCHAPNGQRISQYFWKMTLQKRIKKTDPFLLLLINNDYFINISQCLLI